MQITDEQNAQLAETFAVDPVLDAVDKKAAERRSVRFDPETTEIFVYVEGKREYRRVNRDYTFLSYVEAPAKTPTGGRYMRKQLTVREKKTGVMWYGNVKRDTSVVRLRRSPTGRTP